MSLAALARQFDEAVSHVERVERVIATSLPRLMSSLDSLASLAGDTVGAWEEDLGGCERRLVRIGEQVALLSESLLRQLAALQSTGEADRGALTNRILHLEDELASEQRTRREAQQVHWRGFSS